MMVHLPAILIAIGGVLGTIGGGIGWVYRIIAKRIDTLDAKLAECEKRENDGKDRRATMWRVIDMLLDAIEELGPDHRQLNRARNLLAELRSNDRDQQQMEPAE